MKKLKNFNKKIDKFFQPILQCKHNTKKRKVSLNSCVESLWLVKTNERIRLKMALEWII